MMNRFLLLREEIITVANSDCASFSVDQLEIFKERVKNYTKMMPEIDIVTLKLQKRGIVLAQCRFAAVAILLDPVRNGRQDTKSIMRGCCLSDKYQSPTAKILTDPNFQFGVVKIRNHHERTMTTL